MQRDIINTDFYMKRIRLFKLLLVICILIQYSQRIYAQTTEVINDVIYDVVNVKIIAPTYDTSKPPVCAKVKYNKFCPLIITSDDMGASELVNSWAFFNGYPTYAKDTYPYISKGDDFLGTPYKTEEFNQQNKSLIRKTHQPLTYSDGIGGVRRFTATSAIWPHQVDNTNYTLINGNDARTMIRTGWSFAQHDVDKDYSTNSETIASRFKELSEKWEEAVGIGLKVMVEPNGDHKYIDAGKISKEICWNIFQNGQLPDYPAEKSVKIDDWTTGDDWTTFDKKPETTTPRFFFQDKENEFANKIENADGTFMVLGGTHGMSPVFLNYLKDTVQPSDKFWVAGADEVWEYYHLYNKSQITDVIFNYGVLSFNVKMPRYKKHQFRELTINIPGITNGTSYSISNNAITGGGQQNSDYYTINIGLEDKTYSYIEDLISYYRNNQHNIYVKNDAQYLIDLLLPGDKKDIYQAMLDAEPAYCTYQVTTNVGNMVLASGAQDEATPVTFYFPKYILEGSDLYEAEKNETEPYYVTTFTPKKGINNEIIDYSKAIENVIYFKEGENLDNIQYHPVNTKNINNKNQSEFFVHQWSSGAAGSIITEKVTITTLQPGTYKIAIAAGSSNEKENNNTKYKLKLDNKTIYSFVSDKKGINEYIKDEIIVNEKKMLTLEAQNGNVARWIDYIYIQRLDSGTGIINTTPSANKTTTPIYNMMGIKVNKTKKGIYIENGKKIVRK